MQMKKNMYYKNIALDDVEKHVKKTCIMKKTCIKKTPHLKMQMKKACIKRTSHLKMKMKKTCIKKHCT